MFRIKSKEIEAQTYQQLLDRLRDWSPKQKIINSYEALQAEATKDGDYLYRLGEQDGTKGMSLSTIRPLIENRANLWQGHFNHSLKKMRNQLLGKVKEREIENNNQHTQLESHRTYLYFLRNKHQLNGKDFNISMGIIYLIIALVLVVADIPLSLQLTANGFGWDEVNLYSFQWEDLFNPTFALSFGIVLTSVYIKIYYDEFMGSSLENKVSRYKKENLNGLDNEEDIQLLKKVWLNRFIVKTIILVFILSIFILLGFFRQQGKVKNKAQNNEWLFIDTSLRSGIDFLNVELSSNPIPKSSDLNVQDSIRTPDVNTLKNDNKTSTSTVSLDGNFDAELWTIIFITILFPLIGGVCASIGLSRIQNYIVFRKAKRNEKKLQKAISTNEKEISTFSQTISDLNELILSSEEGSSLTNKLEQILFGFYRRGFEKGRQLAMSNDLMQFADKAYRMETSSYINQS